MPSDDAVKHPGHYNATKYEAWDVLDEWFRHDPLCWNAVKYIQRHEHKAKPVEDLRKAINYLERRIAQLQTESAPTPALDPHGYGAK